MFRQLQQTTQPCSDNYNIPPNYVKVITITPDHQTLFIRLQLTANPCSDKRRRPSPHGQTITIQQPDMLEELLHKLLSCSNNFNAAPNQIMVRQWHPTKIPCTKIITQHSNMLGQLQHIAEPCSVSNTRPWNLVQTVQ